MQTTTIHNFKNNNEIIKKNSNKR